MPDYRNILRVVSNPHKSMRTMEQELRSSRHTIQKVLAAAVDAGISWSLPETVFNEMLMKLLFPEEYQKRHAMFCRNILTSTQNWPERA